MEKQKKKKKPLLVFIIFYRFKRCYCYYITPLPRIVYSVFEKNYGCLFLYNIIYIFLIYFFIIIIIRWPRSFSRYAPYPCAFKKKKIPRYPTLLYRMKLFFVPSFGDFRIPYPSYTPASGTQPFVSGGFAQLSRLHTRGNFSRNLFVSSRHCIVDYIVCADYRQLFWTRTNAEDAV